MHRCWPISKSVLFSQASACVRIKYSLQCRAHSTQTAVPSPQWSSARSSASIRHAAGRSDWNAMTTAQTLVNVVRWAFVTRGIQRDVHATRAEDSSPSRHCQLPPADQATTASPQIVRWCWIVWIWRSCFTERATTGARSKKKTSHSWSVCWYRTKKLQQEVVLCLLRVPLSVTFTPNTPAAATRSTLSTQS